MSKNFLGIPIEGNISGGDRQVKQRPLEEFQPIVQAVLDDPTIGAVQWTQYTPYFNDGDPCTFSAYEVYVLPAETHDDTEDDDYDGYDIEESKSWIAIELGYGEHAETFMGKAEYHWEGTWGVDRRKVIDSYTGPDRERYDRLHELSSAIQGGEFDHVLQELFGDHCTVKITREKITVDEYSHD